MADEPATPADAVSGWLKRNGSWLALGFALVFFVLPYVSPFGGLNQYLQAPRRFSEWTLRKLQHLFTDYGYYVVFFGVLMENAMFLGLLVPGSIILILGGLAAENGSINLGLVIALGIAGTVIGDTISYFIGRMGWSRFLERGTMGEMMAKFRTAMEKNSTWIILAYHFAGYSRVVGPAGAGMFRVPYRKWAPLDFIGGSLWVTLYVMIGVVLGLFGLEFGDTKTMARFIEWFFTALLVVAVAIAWWRTSKSSGDGGDDGDASPKLPIALLIDEEL